MSTTDKTRWDERYRSQEKPAGDPGLPARFALFEPSFIEVTDALEIACGSGQASVWLAKAGVQVTGYDISPVAISSAKELATLHGVDVRCTFAVADFDEGLPSGEEVDLVLCNMFRDPSLDQAMIARLRPGGLLAVAALSEVGAEPGPFRAKPKELVEAFRSLELVESHEDDGVAWLLARKV